MHRSTRALRYVTFCILAGSSAAGCGASVATETSTGTTPATSHASPRPMTAAHGGGSSASCASGSVYFSLDSATLDSASASTLSCIPRNSSEVSIVGMTDPRGTEEYNLALGERRARSVAEHLGRLGYDASHIQTRSLGEEAATGKSEDGWARDRRANFAAQ